MKMCLQSKGAVAQASGFRGVFKISVNYSGPYYETTHAAFVTMYIVRILHSINARLHETAVAYYSVSRSVACPIANSQRTRFL